MTPAAQAKDITIEDRIRRPVFVLADRVRFREIVVNLLSNAVKFTPKGGSVGSINPPRRRTWRHSPFRIPVSHRGGIMRLSSTVPQVDRPPVCARGHGLDWQL